MELRGSVLAGFHIAPVPCQYEIHLEGSFQALEARLWGNYEGNKWPIHPPGILDGHSQAIFPLQDKQKTACFYVRDSSAERELIKRLERYKFESSGGFWQLRKPDEILTFYSQGLSKFPENVTIIKGERWAHVTRNTFHIAPNLKPEKRYTNDQGGTGNDWLSMEFAYEAPDGFRLARTEVLRLIRSGQRQINGRNGQKYILNNESIEELEESLRDVPVQMTPEGVRIHAAHADYFQSGSAVSLVLPAMEQIRSSLGPLADILRDYQLEGIRWLVARTQAGRGGILADDMGLGKTLQTIATILSTGPERGPVMVICPKSLLGNWEAEFARFTPALRVLKIDGTGREKHFAKISAHDVILTSYPLIHRDLDSYATYDFRLIFLDEASFIKNPDTDASKSVRKLRAGARFALTGTPLENGVRDLWSIMSFALPGYLGSRENFKERFEQPVTSHLNAPAGQQAAERLRRLLKPWFLRRTKRQVLRELPEKIEQVLWCDPSPAQAEVYRRILEEGREEIKAARRRSGQNGSRMTMFTVLLRLRQVCCDLRLAKLPEETIKALQNDDLSGKWSALLDRLDSVIESGGKVLVFSQFVEFLRFMREQLLLRKIDFCYLDGQSNDRADQVISFQTQAEKRVFLISLKAGGYGLNLTAADHVILADPWWNPAVESQAIDRAHRLGQQRVVNAYRLIVRGTVEERILALQAKKRGLVEATLEEDFGTGAGLSDSEMEELLG
ncbi:MAG: SNF2 helicase associated domain-containing protein [Verrucomicrobiaceae bacterium]|nr:SNF2 helicase associated domain-containing protein [Verrucomicrobiaceae bacterium]